MVKGKVYYGQESPRGEVSKLSTTSSNATEVAQWTTPSCGRTQPDTDNDVRGGRYN